MQTDPDPEESMKADIECGHTARIRISYAEQHTHAPHTDTHRHIQSHMNKREEEQDKGAHTQSLTGEISRQREGEADNSMDRDGRMGGRVRNA